MRVKFAVIMPVFFFAVFVVMSVFFTLVMIVFYDFAGNRLSADGVSAVHMLYLLIG